MFGRTSGRYSIQGLPRLYGLLSRLQKPSSDIRRGGLALWHGRMVKLVNRMLVLHKQLAVAKTGHDNTTLQRQIDATDRQVDRLVYELYGLTETEIAIVEEAA